MPRTPRLTPAALDRSVLLADAGSCILDVLMKLHPNDTNLRAANSMFIMFERALGEAARDAKVAAAQPSGLADVVSE